MATYKVIQDIEAEDKLLGPFSLRQFIYLVVALGCAFMLYFIVSKAPMLGGIISPFLLIPMGFFGFLAFPWTKDQPTELWALARLNFMFRPRKRLWDQTGARDLVTIAVPKRVEKQYTDGLSQHEVKSRLHALAQTLDSRGWAVQNAGQPQQIIAGQVASSPDRLIDTNSLPQEVPAEQFNDPLDPSRDSAIAAHFDSMLKSKEQSHHAELVAKMSQPIEEKAPPVPPPNDFWFMHQSQAPQDAPKDNVMFQQTVVNPGQATEAQPSTPVEDSTSEASLLNELKAHEVAQPKNFNHLNTIQPLDVQRQQAAERQAALQQEREALAAAYQQQTPENTSQQKPAETTDTPMTAAPNAAILGLAQNDDLSVETIAHQAKKAIGKTITNDDGSVEISLH